MTGWLLWIAILLVTGAALHHFEERLARTPAERPGTTVRGGADWR